MNQRVEGIIKKLSMYEQAEGVKNFFSLHDTVIYELHIELEGIYNIVEKKDIESDLKELELYTINLTDHHKKQLLHSIISYIESILLKLDI